MHKQITHHARAVVTGAGSGIGRAFALELARRGGQLICADIDLTGAQHCAEEIQSRGGQALAIECDVSDPQQLVDLAAAAQAWFGQETTLLINNAGVAAGGKVGSVPLEDWHWVMGINLWGVIHGCHEFVPRFRAAGRGAILNVASMAGLVSAPEMAPYNVSKYGVVALTETLAAEFAGTPLRATVLCPTFVKTNIVRSARIGDQQLGPLAQKLMDRVGMSPDRVAKIALNGLERGDLYVIPQLDARALWRTKRLLPAGLTGGMGLLQQLRSMLNKA